MMLLVIGAIDWTVVLSWIGASSVFLGLLTWLARSLFAHILSRDVERFKAKLELSALEHQVRFGRLHAKQATVISELYEKLLPAKWGFSSLRHSDAKDFTDND